MRNQAGFTLIELMVVMIILGLLAAIVFPNVMSGPDKARYTAAQAQMSGFETALKLLKPRGTLVLKSTFHGATELDAAPVVVDELSIVGSRCGRFAPALELLARDAVEVAALIHDEFPLADALQGMRRAAAPGVLKVLLRP